jgi:hypothetical protein
MKLSIPLLIVGGLGALCLWCGITDRNPIAVMKAILTNQALPGKGTLKHTVSNPATPIVPPNTTLV